MGAHFYGYRLILFLMMGARYLLKVEGAEAPVKILNIGVLIEDSLQYRTYFNFAFNQTNTDMAHNSMPFKFRPLFRVVKNSNHVLSAVCDLLEFRDAESQPSVIAIFAPQDPLLACLVQSFADLYLIPVIHFGETYQLDKTPNSMYVNMYPHFLTIKRLLKDTISFFHWNDFAIFYTDEKSFRELEGVISQAQLNNQSFVAWKIGVDGEHFSQKLLKEFRQSKISNVVVDITSRDIRPLLRKLQKLQLLSANYHYIFNNFYSGDYDLSDYMEGESNFTSFQIVNYESEEYRRLGYIFHWAGVNDAFRRAYPEYNQDYPLTSDLALIVDSLKLLRVGLASMWQTTPFQPDYMSCNSNHYWRQGLTFLNYIRTVSVETSGLTGSMTLNGFGQRNDLAVNVLHRVSAQMMVVGNWSPKIGMNVSVLSSSGAALELLNNKTLKVTTILQPPFTMLRNSEEPVSGNDRFEGYCVDLLEKMKEYMSKDGINFQYKIELVKDGKFGSFHAENKSWNGMVGEIQRGEADLAVAPLTINYERQDYIDFSVPYMNLGISILFRRRESRTPSIFSFLLPLHMNIWMYLIVSYLAISTVLFLLSRFSPYERQIVEDPTVPKLTLANSFWFSAGAMMQQGSEIVPQALSTRVVSVAWKLHCFYFFLYFLAKLISMNTLFGLMAMSADVSGSSQLADWWPILANQNIQLGAVRSGTSKQFLESNSQIPNFVRMFQFMELHEEEAYVDTTTEGIQRVEEGDYAFLMESTMLEYQLSQKCNLTQVGGLLDSKFYGIGLRKGSPYKHYLSKAILQLQDDGVLVTLKKRWWEERGVCIEHSGGEDASALKMDSIGGIFYVLIVGTIAGLFIALLEFFWRIRGNAKTNNSSFWKEAKKFIQLAYRKDEMFFDCVSTDEESDHDKPDGKTAPGKSGESSGKGITFGLYSNAGISSLTTPLLASPNTPNSPFSSQTFHTIPGHGILNNPGLVTNGFQRNNSVNSTLKSSFSANNANTSSNSRAGLKLRFSPNVEKQIYNQEHASDQSLLSNNVAGAAAVHAMQDHYEHITGGVPQGSVGHPVSPMTDSATQTKNVRIKTDTDV